MDESRPPLSETEMSFKREPYSIDGESKLATTVDGLKMQIDKRQAALDLAEEFLKQVSEGKVEDFGDGSAQKDVDKAKASLEESEAKLEELKAGEKALEKEALDHKELVEKIAEHFEYYDENKKNLIKAKDGSINYLTLPILGGLIEQYSNLQESMDKLSKDDDEIIDKFNSLEHSEFMGELAKEFLDKLNETIESLEENIQGDSFERNKDEIKKLTIKLDTLKKLVNKLYDTYGNKDEIDLVLNISDDILQEVLTIEKSNKTFEDLERYFGFYDEGLSGLSEAINEGDKDEIKKVLDHLDTVYDHAQVLIDSLPKSNERNKQQQDLDKLDHESYIAEMREKHLSEEAPEQGDDNTEDENDDGVDAQGEVENKQEKLIEFRNQLKELITLIRNEFDQDDLDREAIIDHQVKINVISEELISMYELNDMPQDVIDLVNGISTFSEEIDEKLDEDEQQNDIEDDDALEEEDVSVGGLEGYLRRRGRDQLADQVKKSNEEMEGNFPLFAGIRYLVEGVMLPVGNRVVSLLSSLNERREKRKNDDPSLLAQNENARQEVIDILDEEQQEIVNEIDRIKRNVVKAMDAFKADKDAYIAEDIQTGENRGLYTQAIEDLKKLRDGDGNGTIDLTGENVDVINRALHNTGLEGLIQDHKDTVEEYKEDKQREEDQRKKAEQDNDKSFHITKDKLKEFIKDDDGDETLIYYLGLLNMLIKKGKLTVNNDELIDLINSVDGHVKRGEYNLNDENLKNYINGGAEGYVVGEFTELLLENPEFIQEIRDKIGIIEKKSETPIQQEKKKRTRKGNNIKF